MENVKGNKMTEEEITQATEQIEKYMEQDLRWLRDKEQIDEKTDWKLFVAYRIKGMILNGAFKVNQNRLSYEKQDLAEEWSEFWGLIGWMQDTGYLKFNYDYMRETYDFSEILEQEEFVTKHIGSYAFRDIVNFKTTFEHTSFDSEWFQGILDEVTADMKPFLMEGLNRGLRAVDKTKSGREKASYVNTAVKNTYISMNRKSQGYIKVQDGEESRYFKPKLSEDKDCFLFLLKQTFNVVGLDKLEKILTKSQYTFIMNAYDIVKEHYDNGDKDWFRYDINKKSQIEKRKLAKEMGMSEQNFHNKLGRIQNKIDLVWSDLFAEFLLSA